MLRSHHKLAINSYQIVNNFIENFMLMYKSETFVLIARNINSLQNYYVFMTTITMARIND